MRIAILESAPDQPSATGVRGRAMRDFLVSRGHEVDVLHPAPDEAEQFQRHRWSLRSRLARRLWRRPALPHSFDYIADRLQPRIRDGGYQAVIARGPDVATVLTRPLACLKIVDVANVAFLESYYSWGSNLAEVQETFEKECAVLAAADFVLSPHALLTGFLIEAFSRVAGLAAKVTTVRLGCEPTSLRARPGNPPRIVYAGSYYYIQDPYLLSILTGLSEVPIDCYGPSDPNRGFLPTPLHYRGFAKDTSFLSDYQFGLITVSADRLRRRSPATKFPYYFSYGLPVLFPEWMQEGHEYGECAIPFTEETFVERVRKAAQPECWPRLSEAARATAAELTWDKTLQPLLPLLEGREANGGKRE